MNEKSITTDNSDLHDSMTPDDQPLEWQEGIYCPSCGHDEYVPLRQTLRRCDRCGKEYIIDQEDKI